MKALKMNPFRRVVPILSLLFFGASLAAGSVVELPELENKLPGRVFIYLPDGGQADYSRALQAVDEEIPKYHPSPGTPAPKGWPGPSMGQDVDSKRMKLLGRAFEEGGMAMDVAAYDQYAYVGTSGSLSVFDVSDPEKPVPGLILPETASILDRKGSLLAGVVGSDTAFVLFDLTDPGAPLEVSRLPPPEGFKFMNLSLGDSLAVVYGWGILDPFGWTGLAQVIDVSDPSTPVVKSSLLAVFNFFRDVLIEGNTIYLSFEYEGIAILDVTDPISIIQLGFHSGYGYIDGMAYENGYLYCAGNGLEVLDVSNPTDPELISQVGSAHTFDIRISNDVAYLTDDDDYTLRIIDVTDPADPQEVVNFQAYGRTHHMDLSGNKVFVTDVVYGLLVVDVSNPASPSLDSMTSPGTYPEGGDLEGDLFAIIGNRAHLYTLDVSDPFAPEILGGAEWEPDTIPNNTPRMVPIDLKGDVVVTGEINYGVRTYDVTEPTLPERLGDLKLCTGKDAGFPVVRMGQWVYTGESQLVVVDISDPKNPVQVGTGPTVQGEVMDIKISNGYGYMAGHNEVVIVDLALPTQPQELSRFTLNIEKWIGGLAVENDVLGVYWECLYYVPQHDSGFELYDVSNPNAPAHLSSFENPYFMLWSMALGPTVKVDNGRFFVCNKEILMVIDAKDPLNLFLAATYPEEPSQFHWWQGFHSVCVEDGLVYLSGLKGLEILRFLDVGVFLTPEADPVVLHAGESFTYDMRIENFTEDPQTLYAWVDEVFPGGGSTGPSASPLWITLGPGESVTYQRQQEVPGNTPVGTYYLYAHVKAYPDVEMDMDRIAIEVIAD